MRNFAFPVLARTMFYTVVLLAVLTGVTVSVRAASAIADVNQREVDGSTPLQWAVYEGNVAEVKRLLEAGADVSLANYYGATAMQLASEVGDAAILKLLLAAGADPDSANAEGQTALLAVARTGNVEAAQLLLDHGATVDAREQWGEQTALMWASARRHPQMMQLLIANGADLNARSIDRDYQRHVTAEGRPKFMDTGGFTPLLYAARENCLACVEVLLKNDVDIDLPDPDGVSPLLLTTMNANWDLAKQLILAGANVDQWDIYGEAPLFVTIGLRSQVSGGRASIDPFNATEGMTIVRMLLERGANPNMQLFFRPADLRGPTFLRGSTPMIRAATNADLEVVNLLLEYGADINLHMADRQTATMAVLSSRKSEAQALEVIRRLHEAGEDVNVIALGHHLQRIRGGTALHYAVRKRWKQAIKELASYGIDVNAKDQDGLTALDYTQSRGYIPFMLLQTPVYDDLATLLRDLGATVELDESPEWPIVGPPQGIDPDIWPL